MYIKMFVEDGAKKPERAYEYDAGYDLFNFGVINSSLEVFDAGYYKSFHTGVHVEIPKGYAGFVLPKSGLYRRYGMHCCGVIDSTYTGEIVVTMSFEFNSDWKKLVKHEKIAQLVITPILQPEIIFVDSVTELNTGRGNNGFGSTGRF